MPTTSVAGSVDAVERADGPQVATRLLKRAVHNAAQLTFDQAGDDIASSTAPDSSASSVAVQCARSALSPAAHHGSQVRLGALFSGTCRSRRRA